MKDGKGKGGKGAQKHAARKATGGAPKQKPLAILDKVNTLFYQTFLKIVLVCMWTGQRLQQSKHRCKSSA